MERFQRRDAMTWSPIEVQVFPVDLGGDRWDDQAVVRLLFADGRRYEARFCRGYREQGGHWWEEPGMVLVQDLTVELIMNAVDDILLRGAAEAAFEPIFEV